MLDMKYFALLISLHKLCIIRSVVLLLVRANSCSTKKEHVSQTGISWMLSNIPQYLTYSAIGAIFIHSIPVQCSLLVNPDMTVGFRYVNCQPHGLYFSFFLLQNDTGYNRRILADRTNSRAYATVLRLSFSVVCNVVLWGTAAAKRCLLLQNWQPIVSRIMRNRLVPKWLTFTFIWRSFKVTWTIASH